MTNYNERLDEIFYQYRDDYNDWQSNPRGSGTNGIKLQNKAKQAITDLFLSIVGEDEDDMILNINDACSVEDRNQLRQQPIKVKEKYEQTKISVQNTEV